MFLEIEAISLLRVLIIPFILVALEPITPKNKANIAAVVVAAIDKRIVSINFDTISGILLKASLVGINSVNNHPIALGTEAIPSMVLNSTILLHIIDNIIIKTPTNNILLFFFLNVSTFIIPPLVCYKTAFI